MDVILPYTNMKVDPRIIISTNRWGYKFSFFVKGRTLTITRMDTDDPSWGEGWRHNFRLRVYMPTEDIPDFTSTIYTYWGLDGEGAPKDTTKVIFHPSVTTIGENAFHACRSLVRVTIPDSVKRIEKRAFYDCDSLRYILLPRNLEVIEEMAFIGCESLHAVFLPPTVVHILEEAFSCCKSLRFLHVPAEIEHIGNKAFWRCDRLLTTVKYEFDYEDDDDPMNNDEVNEWLMQRHANLPFHQACYSIFIDPQVIVHGIERATEVDDQQMTALHILCANPHVTSDCIRAYLQLAPEAADQEDSEGMTPLQYLCRNDINFFEEDRSFSSLIAWWYHCMPPQTQASKKRKHG